jgi:hypothetical protein
MKKSLFSLLFMTIMCFSFCVKKPCEEKRNSVTQTVTYIETDTLGGFKGQNTLGFFSTCSCLSATGLDCVNGAKGGCFGTGFSVTNLTNKKVTIRMFAAEDEARLNQTPKTVLTCQPNGVSQISDAGLSFLSNPCSADLQKLVRVSYQ